jgi:multimeric flavodoxin WrbA
MSKVPLVQVIYYSTYGHIEKMARHVVKGLDKSGVHHQIYQVPETLSKETLQSMKAPLEKPLDIPVLGVEDMEKADGFIFGCPTRKLSKLFRHIHLNKKLKKLIKIKKVLEHCLHK